MLQGLMKKPKARKTPTQLMISPRKTKETTVLTRFDKNKKPSFKELYMILKHEKEFSMTWRTPERVKRRSRRDISKS